MNRLYRVCFLVLLLALSPLAARTQTPLSVENFDYPEGTILNTISGYAVRSGGGINVQRIVAPGLTYAGYAGSGIGNCDSVFTNGEDLSRDFSPGITSGSVYLAALVNVTAAQATGDYFLSFHYNNTFNGKVFVKSTTGGFYFGSGKNNAVYDSLNVRSFNTTYLIVVKYSFNGGTNDDRIDFWVDPTIGGTEPTPTIANMTDAARSDYAQVAGFVLRQGTSTSAATAKIDGIRMATEWAIAVAGPSYTITAGVVGSGTITPSGSVLVNGGADQLFTFAPNTGHHFDSLVVDGSRVDSTSSYTFYAVSTAHSITAYFSPNQQTLTVSATNGTVSRSPDQATYDYGTIVSLTATPDPGYSFVNWTGDVPAGHETDNPLSLTMDGDKTLTANFSSNTYTITASAEGTGTITPSGAVVVNGGSDQQFTFSPGAGHHFDSLLVDGAAVDSSASYTFYNVAAPHTITAYFSPNQYTLTVNAVGGTVAKDPDLPTYPYHTSVQLTATPEPGYRFYGWTGDLNGSSNPATVAVDSNMTITALFTVGATFTWSGGTGAWATATNWTPTGIPGAADTALFNVTSPVSVCTIEQDVTVAKLIMTGSGSTASSGPILQFAPSGSITLTVADTLRIAGGSGGGNGDRGGRSQLTSNGNPEATLVLLGYATTTSSNSTANGNAGLNMNEGNTVISGSGTSTLTAAAGFRVGNLQVGDGTNPKTFHFMTTSSVSSSQRMAPSSIVVKKDCQFYLGDPAANFGVNVGNTTVGITNLTGGITVESGALLTVNPTTGASNNCTIELMGGGITNHGQINPAATNRFLNLNVTAGPDTLGGTAPIAFNNVTVNSATGIVLGQALNVGGTVALTLGDVDLNGNTLTLGPNGSLAETAGNTVTGATGVVRTTRTITAPGGTEIAGLGLTISPSVDMGVTEISRGHGTSAAGSASIARTFEITPTVNAGLNATLRFRYDTSELNGLSESQLALFRSSDGTDWSLVGGTVDTLQHAITVTGVNSLSWWTAATRLPVPGGVVLLSPANGAILTADSVLLVWASGGSSITGYWLETATDSLFTAPLVDSTLTDTSVVVDGLINNQTYWWRVKAKNETGWGAYSEKRSYKAVLTDIPSGTEAPFEFTLSQNYPNPFNPSTQIAFSVEAAGHTTLEVYNVIGQRVATLFDGMAEPGQYYRVRLDGSNMASGVYLYRLQSGNKSALRKLLLLK